MPGRHLVPHALAAAAVAEHLAVPMAEVEAALAEGSHAAHRMALLEAASGATLIDDTYNASPVSVAAALDFLAETPVASGRRRYAVLGDMLELGPDEERLHREIGARAATIVDGLVAVGERGRWIAEAATAAGLARPSTAPDAEAAVATVERVLAPAKRGPRPGQGIAGHRARPAGDGAGRRRVFGVTMLSILLALLLAFLGVVLLGPIYIRAPAAPRLRQADPCRGARGPRSQGGHPDHGRDADGAWS